MTTDERYRRMDAARLRAQLTVQDLWLRYLALGGTGDAFDLDGYLQGLVPLDTIEQDVLAQALNEALRDLYQSHLIPLSTPAAVDGWDDDRLRGLMARLLDDQSPARHQASVVTAAGSGDDRADGSVPVRPVAAGPRRQARALGGGDQQRPPDRSWLASLPAFGAASTPRSAGDALGSLLRASHLMAPDQLASVAAEHARRFGAQELVIYLVDYGQSTLHPLPGHGAPARDLLNVDGSAAGRAFRRVEVIDTAAADGLRRMWLPLLDGVERLGVVEIVATEDAAGLDDAARAFVSLLAELVVANDLYSDVFARTRRRRPLSLSAEIQWQLLPPLTFASDHVVIAGLLEPAYEIGGDTFDYAVNGSTADLMVLDAVGHGLPAAVLASVAIGAYRHARREVGDLPAITAAVNTAVAGQFPDSAFATAVLARLDVDTGLLRWVNAGHPAPLIVRGGALIPTPGCRPHPPLGLQEGPVQVCSAQLHAGDRVLLYTDGIVEARSPAGEFFGERRLADFIIRADAAGDSAPETLRRLIRHVLDHQADHLQDDASIVVVEWRTGDEQQLEP
ncbi:PP2C family protein-serine/threonine phosphatase [Geodermatophilus maliterrae]|uniref:PP2C family protein-serine/threonine phosphatase n=1 Tax=Geodermatophilus maliterrae TaxID=3162531 RepID=A0ABV3XAL3_9ACTN